MKKNRLLQPVIVLFLLAASLAVTGFDPLILIKRGEHAAVFIRKMVPPDTSYISDILRPLLNTIQMSIAGTMIGAFLGLFGTFLYAPNINKNHVLRTAAHAIVQLVRTIPVLIIALLCTFLFGTGMFAGTLALSLSTWAVLTRIGGEDVSKLSLKSYEAIVNLGAGRMKAFVRTVLIEMLPGYLTNALYLLETNIRHAAILGYVGAGGIGLLMNEKIAWREYEKLGMILILLYAAVIFIEFISVWLRNYLNGTYKRTPFRSRLIIEIVSLSFLFSLSAVRLTKSSSLGLKVAGSIVSGILHPDLGYLFLMSRDGVLFLMLETVCIAIAGTIFGAVLALFFTVLNSFRIMPKPVAAVSRLFVMAVRTIPVYVYGLIFIRVTGPGSFAGVLTMTICSIGLLTKRFSVALDNLDLRPWNAYKSMGIGWFARIKYCIWLPLLPQLKQSVLYRFDVNIRSASILGLVGAGGIGAPLIIYMNNYKWDAVGAILIVLFIAVLVIEKLSDKV